MSNYYKLKFTSPEPLYAKIKESLRSYFESGAIDDLLFPIWTDDALKLFRKSTFQIKEQFIKLDDYQANLPDDFESVREVWACRSVIQHVPTPNAIYYQKDCRVTVVDEQCHPCNLDPKYDFVRSCDPCEPDYRVTHKITGEVLISYKFSHLLCPGNINTRSKCADNCANLQTTSIDTFDIHSNKILTNFCNGSLHLIYYADRKDIEGDPLIPENARIQRFVENYIYARCFEILWNQVNDESSNQLEKKMMFYQKRSDDSYLDALVELKRETKEQIYEAINKVKSRYNPFRLR